MDKNTVEQIREFLLYKREGHVDFRSNSPLETERFIENTRADAKCDACTEILVWLDAQVTN